MHIIYFKRIWVSYLALDSLPPFVLEENLVHFSAVFTRYVTFLSVTQSTVTQQW